MKTLPIAKTYNALVNADASRPLANLTKEQLLIYPKAVATPEADRIFRKELLVRRGMEVAITKGVEQAEDRIKDTMRYYARNAIKDQAGRDQYDERLAKLEKDKARAQEEVAKLPANPYVVMHQEIVKHYRDTHWHEYAPMLQKYVDGTLFHAQTYGWITFLGADAKTRRADDVAFESLQAMASLCGDEDGLTFRSARAMWILRIVPSIERRHMFTDEDGTLANVNAFQGDLKKTYWRQWRAYNLSTLNWKWVDDSGVAYDERTFDPDMDIEAKF